MVSTCPDWDAGNTMGPSSTSSAVDTNISPGGCTSTTSTAEQQQIMAGPDKLEEIMSSNVVETSATEQLEQEPEKEQLQPQQPQHGQQYPARPPLSPFSTGAGPAFPSSMRKSMILSLSEDEGVETDATTEASSSDSDGGSGNTSPISASGEGAAAPMIATIDESHRCHQSEALCEVDCEVDCEERAQQEQQQRQEQEEQLAEQRQLVKAGSGGSSSSSSGGANSSVSSRSPLTQFFLCCSMNDENNDKGGGAPSSSSACESTIPNEPPLRPFPASCRACVALWTEKTRERFERNIESLLSTVDSRRDPISGPADADASGEEGAGGAAASSSSSSSSWSRNFEGRYRKLIDGGLSNLKEAEEAEQRRASAAAAAEARAEGEDGENGGGGDGDAFGRGPSLPRYRRSLLSLPRNRDTRLRWMRRKMTMSAPRGSHAGGMGVGVGAVFGRRRTTVADADASVSEGDLLGPPIRKAQSFDDHVLRSRRLRGHRGGLTRSSPGGGGFGARQASSIAACQVLEDDCRRSTHRSSGNGAGVGGGGTTFAFSQALHLACECGAGRVASDEINGGTDGPGGAAAHFGDRSLLESDDDEDGGYDSDPESFVGTHRYSADILQPIRSQEEEDDDEDDDEGGDNAVDDNDGKDGGNGDAAEAETAKSRVRSNQDSRQVRRRAKEDNNTDNKGRGRSSGAVDFHDAETMSQLVEEVMHTSMTLIWHPSSETPKNNDPPSSEGGAPAPPPTSSSVHRIQPPTCVKAWIELGCRVKGQIIQPKLVWRNAYHYEGVGAVPSASSSSGSSGGAGGGGLIGSSPGRGGGGGKAHRVPGSTGGAITDARQRGMAAVGVSSDTLRSVDVLDIARILTPRREIDRDRYPLAKTSKSFTIVTTDGTVHLFEVAESSERDRLVSGLKLLVARLASLIIVGDKRLFDDFFYPATSSDFQRKFCGDDSGLSYLE